MHRLIPLILILAAMGCALPVSLQPETYEHEIQIVLDMGDHIFEPELWYVRAAGEEVTRTTVTWSHRQLSALAYFDYLHVERGVTPQTIPDYLSPEGVETLVSNYESSTVTDRCEREGTHLVEVQATNTDTLYDVSVWATPISENRALVVILTLPTTDSAEMQRYAAQLFPAIPSCEAVG